MPSQDVCPSVRHTPEFCQHRWTYPQTFFHNQVAPQFLFFHTKHYGNIPTGTSLNGGAECKGGIKKRDFRPISRCISEMMQVRAIVTMEGEYETAHKLSNDAISNDLEWLLT